MSSKERIAIVHDGFAPDHEAERVTAEIARLLPHADILSTGCVEERWPHTIRSQEVKRSWMKYLPARERLHRQYLLLHPFAIQGMDLSGYSVVISSCEGFAKAARCPVNGVHVCYCHAPARAIWRYHDVARSEQLNSATGLLMLPVRAGLRKIDAASSVKPDYYVARSNQVAREIKRCYGRNAMVIHPPVDVAGYRPSARLEDYFLIVSTLSIHKRIDMIIAACNSTGSRLLIVGDGPDRQRLEELAGPTVTLLGDRTESEIAEMTARCQAVFCVDAEERFDPMPIKANAAGRPAIGFATETAAETIANGESGVLYEECTRPGIVDAMRRCRERNWQTEVLRAYSRRFDCATFRDKFACMLQDILGPTALRPAS